MKIQAGLANSMTPATMVRPAARMIELGGRARVTLGADTIAGKVPPQTSSGIKAEEDLGRIRLIVILGADTIAGQIQRLTSNGTTAQRNHGRRLLIVMLGRVKRRIPMPSKSGRILPVPSSLGKSGERKGIPGIGKATSGKTSFQRAAAAAPAATHALLHQNGPELIVGRLLTLGLRISGTGMSIQATRRMARFGMVAKHMLHALRRWTMLLQHL